MISSQSKKSIMITGCSSGFGLLTAARLASQGHKVFATMRDLTKRQSLLEEMSRRGGNLDILPLDVTDIPSIKKAMEQIQQKSQQIDVLINNAGYAIGGSFEDLTQDEIHQQLKTNFFGVQNVIREVIPIMRTQGAGQIINISSIAGLYALPGLGAYNASKWALEGFSESLYYELKPFGIHVCLVEPGSYRTKIFFENRRVAAGADNRKSPYHSYTQAFQKKVDDSIQRNRKDPEDIAILIERLIRSEKPRFRNIPDLQSKILFILKRFLPFRLFSEMIYRNVSK